MYLFLANTTTQIINAIVLMNTLLHGHEADLFYTSEAASIIKKVDQEHIFRRTYLIDLPKDICNRSTALRRSIVRVKNAIDYGKVKRSIPGTPNEYSRIFASGISLRNFEFYYAIKNTNPSVQLSLYEEGVCEYYTLGLKRSLPKALFSHFFFQHYYLEECDSLYVYNPHFVQCIWKRINIIQIPNYKNNQSILAILNRLFDYNAPLFDNMDDKVIILEQAFGSEEQELRQRQTIEHISSIIGKDRIVIKLHPRSDPDKYDGYYCMQTKIPIEVIVSNEEVVNMVFISVSSSAILNLKLIFDIEPRIIVLNQIGKKHKEDNLTPSDQLYRMIERSCTCGNFQIPRSIEELDEILACI